MLHILWMILKFILILIGILLGLLVLALLLLLFCPVRYKAEAAGNLEEWRKAQADVSVSWLFRGIMVRMWLEEGSLSHSIRIFGISPEKLLHRKKPSASSGSRNSSEKKKQGQQAVSAEKEQASAYPESPQRVSDVKQNTEQIEDTAGRPEEEIKENIKEDIEEKINTKASEDIPLEENKKKHESAFGRIRNKISAFLDKLKKIPETIRNFISKISEIYDKINYWKQFLSHPRVKEAFAFVWQNVKKLLKHIFPTRIEGHVAFGCEDPSVTGTILAVLGITIPFHKNCIEVNPMFDGNNLLKGDVKLRGRVYGIVIVKTAVQIYFNKNIKYVINRWKHKEESL
ncbi:MAG: DUF2953 domain-containing protein [Eubacteriales bacterium]|nr:DUF2953 domain-containing protein [Eubacteriales bacterium]